MSAPFSQVVQHLNKTSFLLHQHLAHESGFCCSRQPILCFSVTVFVNSGGTVWTLVNPRGPELGSQLPVAGQPWESRTVGISQQLQRAFLWEFPCIPSQGSGHLKCLLVKGNGFLASRWTPDWVSSTSVHTRDPLSLPLGFCVIWALCHMVFVTFGSG